MGYRKCILLFCILNLFLEVTDVFTHPTSAPQACIIGAGYSGLGAARHMKDYGVNFKIFEATRFIGGTWRYDPRVGLDEDGLPLFTSAYKNMRTNTIQQTIAYPGFPFPEDSPTYLSGTCVYKYLLAFAKHFDVEKNIQYHSTVTNVEWVGDKWQLSYMKSVTKKNLTEECNFVVVATGEHSAPNIPSFKNQEEYQGYIIHSHDFKDPEDFRELQVLVVGAGPSGFDVATQLANVSVRLLHSHHFAYKFPDIPGKYIAKPDIEHFTATGAVFKDGSTEEFDIAILCTGYTYNFPFLNYKSAGVLATKKYVMPLYKQIVNINHPSMTFVGIGKFTSGVVRDIQGEYSAAVASGQLKLPSQEEMYQYWFDHAKTLNYTDINVIGNDNMAGYLDALLNETNIPRLPPVIARAVAENRRDWYEDLLKFRDNQYTIISETEYEKKYKPTKEVCNIDV